MVILLAIVASYLMGAIPFGLIIGKVTKGIDIRDFGSGNIGASNVLRTLGKGPAALVFFFDTTKGLLPVVMQIPWSGRLLGCCRRACQRPRTYLFRVS